MCLAIRMTKKTDIECPSLDMLVQPVIAWSSVQFISVHMLSNQKSAVVRICYAEHLEV